MEICVRPPAATGFRQGETNVFRLLQVSIFMNIRLPPKQANDDGMTWA